MFLFKKGIAINLRSNNKLNKNNNQTKINKKKNNCLMLKRYMLN